MQVKRYLAKRFDLERLKKDKQDGDYQGLARIFEQYSDNCDVVEFFAGNGLNGLGYAFKIYLSNERIITKIERVRFEWMCGGWRGTDTLIKRIPLHMGYGIERPDGSSEWVSSEKFAEIFMDDYVIV
jgi:hypothetical protein